MKYLLMLFVSVFFFVLTYASAPTEFTTVDLGLIIFLFAGVFGAELLIARLFARHQTVQILILAGFSTVNILYVNLVLNEVFIDLPTYGKALALLLALFILSTLMRALDENTNFARILLGFFALATVGVLVQTLFSATPKPGVASEHGRTSANNIRVVDFKTTPNVYFIGFDSIVPNVILQRHMGLRTTPYHEVLDTHFRRFRNFFADFIWTRSSLNSLLALDKQHFFRARRNNEWAHFFPGLVPSPLLEIFKYNGYETTTLYRSVFLGKTKGPFVDNYWVSNWSFQLEFGACEFIDTQGLKIFTFLGYCHLIKSKALSSALRVIGVTSYGVFKQDDFLIEKMRAGLRKKTPQFFLAYIYSPGHTVNTFDRKDAGAVNKYVQRYLEKSEETAASFEKIVTFVAEEDPEAIVYVFGDHGPGISRRGSFEEDGAFFVQDRFGVYGGIHPSDRCAESFAKPYNKDYVTVLQAAHMIIRCLSGGENAFLKLGDYRLPKFGTKAHKRYKDYLYE